MTRRRGPSSTFLGFEGHRVPSPPPELAAEALALTRLAAAAGPPSDWIDRLWENGIARWLWVAVTSCLLAANLSAMRAPAITFAPGDALQRSPLARSRDREDLRLLANPSTLRWYGSQRRSGGAGFGRAAQLASLRHLVGVVDGAGGDDDLVDGSVVSGDRGGR